jgi:hypothetical protein
VSGNSLVQEVHDVANFTAFRVQLSHLFFSAPGYQHKHSRKRMEMGGSETAALIYLAELRDARIH